MLVSVCLCTYKRDTLDKTLRSVVSQSLPDGYTLEVVVVDNDIEESGQSVCEKYKNIDGKVSVRYFVNGVRNLSEVRNSTMDNAKGDLLAFIDDDEWASDDRWLAKMIESMKQHNADAVFGKVIVHYPESAPEWIVEGDLFGKDSYPHHSVRTKGATSNALLKASWVKDKKIRFDPFLSLIHI